MSSISLSNAQQTTLVVLRTLIGWHFLYEGYTKLLHPAWGQDGVPLAQWSSAAYLKAATGPLAPIFHRAGVASWLASLDCVIAIAVAVVGMSLMLGLFTRLGCAGALALLAMFYVSAIPTGWPAPGGEGTYLLVNKNLIEACAVAVLLTFHTGSMAGLDRLRIRSATRPGSVEAVA